MILYIYPTERAWCLKIPGREELSVPRRLGEDIPAHPLSELARVVPAGVGLHLKLRSMVISGTYIGGTYHI